VAGNAITPCGLLESCQTSLSTAEKYTAPEIAREVVPSAYPVCHREPARERLPGAPGNSSEAIGAPCWPNCGRSCWFGKSNCCRSIPWPIAVNYTLNHWRKLNVFCSDGAVPIDNNASEREMKRVVLNRKNSLFVGQPAWRCTAAILASLTSNLPPAPA